MSREFMCAFENFERIQCKRRRSIRSSRWHLFIKIGVLKHFTNFTWKHLCWSLFSIKVFSCQKCVFLFSCLRTTLLKNISGGCILIIFLSYDIQNVSLLNFSANKNWIITHIKIKINYVNKLKQKMFRMFQISYLTLASLKFCVSQKYIVNINKMSWGTENIEIIFIKCYKLFSLFPIIYII